MAEVLLFHHALGLTDGVRAFADHLREGGHTVHTPDLFDGRKFDSIEAGVGYAREVGWGEIMARGERAAESLPNEVIYAGLSLGVVPAQALVQTRDGAKGAVFLYSCLPVSEFGSWPAGVPAQIHGADADPVFMDEGDVDAAHELVAQADDAELFLYPSDQHYFADPGLASSDPEATKLVVERVLAFLARVG